MYSGGTFPPVSTWLLYCAVNLLEWRVGLVLHDCFLCTQTQSYTHLKCVHLLISIQILFESRAVMRKNVHYPQSMLCISEFARELEESLE